MIGKGLILPLLLATLPPSHATITAHQFRSRDPDGAYGHGTQSFWEDLRVVPAIASIDPITYRWKLKTWQVEPTSTDITQPTALWDWARENVLDASQAWGCTGFYQKSGRLEYRFGDDYVLGFGNILRPWGWRGACQATCSFKDGTTTTTPEVRADSAFWGLSYDVLGLCVGATNVTISAGGYCGGCHILSPQYSSDESGTFLEAGGLSDRNRPPRYFYKGVWLTSVGNISAASAYFTQPPPIPFPALPPATPAPPETPFPPSSPPLPNTPPGEDWETLRTDEFPGAAASWTTENVLSNIWVGVGNPPLLENQLVRGISEPSTTFCPVFGNMLGGYGVFGHHAVASKNFSLFNVVHTHLRVQFSLFTLDSWEGEHVELRINGVHAWTTTSHHDQHRNRAANCGRTDVGDLDHKIDVILEDSTNEARIEIRSTLDQGSTDESWGIQDVRISVLSNTSRLEDDDSAVIELTGTAPKIHFGPVLAPICSLSLDATAGHLTSTCELVTPSTGERRLNDETGLAELTEKFNALKVQHDALKAEVAALKGDASQLTNE